ADSPTPDSSEVVGISNKVNRAPSPVLPEAATQRRRVKQALHLPSPGISENIPVPSMPDQLEEKLRSQLEEEKRRYKTMFARLKALKVEIEHLQLLMDKAKVKLQKEFEAWWAAEATSLQVNSPAVTASNHMKPFPQMSEAQHERSQPLSNKSSEGWEVPGKGPEGSAPGENLLLICSDVYARKILPSPGPLLRSQEQSSPATPMEDSIPERPVSSVPLTGDSQTDSDILAFIKARQNILQRTGKSPFPGSSSRAQPANCSLLTTSTSNISAAVGSLLSRGQAGSAATLL
ncbi:hypothetical protein FD755_022450, partial [Muntiacus reevesi]